MRTHMPGFRSFFRFLHHFVMHKLATSSIRVKWSIEPEAQVLLLRQPAYFKRYLSNGSCPYDVKQKSLRLTRVYDLVFLCLLLLLSLLS